MVSSRFRAILVTVAVVTVLCGWMLPKPAIAAPGSESEAVPQNADQRAPSRLPLIEWIDEALTKHWHETGPRPAASRGASVWRGGWRSL